MKPFGRHLVDEGLISEEALLDGLVRQQESLPGVATIVRDLKLLSVENQLRVFKRQWDSGSEYRRAALELGLWSDRIHHEIKRRLVEVRRPLGQVLVEAEVLTLDQLTRALDDFIAVSKSAPAAKPAEPARATPQADPRGTAAGPYCQLFDEDMHFRLKEALAKRAEGEGELRALVRPLAFLARFLGLATSAAAWADFASRPAEASLEGLWSMRQSLIERSAA